ncbi:MAG: DUF420 domain-containing protein [Candidatus Acidiferrales bacterium]
MKGFLGTYAGIAADLNLLLQVAMGVALLAGAWLARRKRFRAHGICAAAVMILNLFSIAFVMWPAFHEQVLPKIPARLGRLHYAIATVHGALGVVAELFGLYIVLMAGTNVLPRSWQLKRWKAWMRVDLALWWVVLAAGFAMYFNWYVR